jgi:hypothetical protein
MRSVNARIIGERTPPIRALALDPRLEAAVLRMGVRRCFPVQATVVPIVLASAAAGVAGDICCCAPTGSGKTLAYALPILQHLLSSSAVCRLRALILLPTRGLATQVFGVLASLCEWLPLRVGLAVGMDGASWEEERQALLGRPSGPVSAGMASGEAGAASRALPGGRSAVDILVATPGRLVEHIRAGGDFTLQHLRWLVIDEADRLLMHGFQSWLPVLLDAAYAQPTPYAQPTHRRLTQPPNGRLRGQRSRAAPLGGGSCRLVPIQRAKDETSQPRHQQRHARVEANPQAVDAPPASEGKQSAQRLCHHPKRKDVVQRAEAERGGCEQELVGP